MTFPSLSVCYFSAAPLISDLLAEELRSGSSIALAAAEEATVASLMHAPRQA